MDHHENTDLKNNGQHKHPILATKTAVKVWAVLLILTGITVSLSYVSLGSVNFLVGMLVATIKASLVLLIFMGLAKDHKSNAVIFCTSFIFLAIFLTLAGTDLLFRGNVYLTPGQALFKPIKGGPSKYKTPWEATPEMVAHGKEVFTNNCVVCHGAEGMGNGPASAALNPKPRNFHGDTGWLNGRKPSQIFKTLKEGVGKMASFGSLPSDDRWCLVAYVSSFNANPLKDSLDDLKKIGIDPSKDGGGESEAPTIPIDVAISQITKDAAGKGNVAPGVEGFENYDARLRAKTY